jgi:N6-adenosine-specific RNA methylase IME4
VKYRTIVADPPWPLAVFDGKGARHASKAVRAIAREPDKLYPLKPLPYSTMSVSEIAELPVGELAEPESHVFVWTFDRFVVDGSTSRVIEAWGFRVLPRMFVWHKASAGLGMSVRPAHELIMVGRRGAKGFKSTTGSVLSVQDWKQPYANGKIHSAKPDGMQDMVEQLCDGPYLELFARRNRLGWDTWGNEALEHVTVGDA